MEPTQDQKAAWHSIAREVRMQRDDGYSQFDLSEFSDEDIALAYSHDVLDEMKFIAEMSDDYSRTRKERVENGMIFGAIREEAEIRGIEPDEVYWRESDN